MYSILCNLFRIYNGRDRYQTKICEFCWRTKIVPVNLHAHVSFESSSNARLMKIENNGGQLAKWRFQKSSSKLVRSLNCRVFSTERSFFYWLKKRKSEHASSTRFAVVLLNVVLVCSFFSLLFPIFGFLFANFCYLVLFLSKYYVRDAKYLLL